MTRFHGTKRSLFTRAAAASSGGIDSYVVWMLHCNGADAGTTFTDSSTSAKTQTARGNAQIDTAQSWGGGASMLLDGTGDWVDTPNSTDFDFGSGDATLDFRLRFNSVGECGFLSNGVSGSGGFSLNYDGASLVWRYASTEVSRTASFSGATWYHVAFVKEGTNGYFFVDGVKQGTTMTVGDVPASTQVMRAGTGNRNSGGAWSTQIYLNGWMDEIRVSKGIARWTSNFTPPSAEYY